MSQRKKDQVTVMYVGLLVLFGILLIAGSIAVLWLVSSGGMVGTLGAAVSAGVCEARQPVNAS